MSGTATFTILLALFLGAPLASGAGTAEDVQSTLVAISVLSLPLTGLLVLAIVTLLTFLEGYPVAEPVSFHMANVIVVTALLTFLDALLVPFVYVEGVSTTLSFALIGVLDLLLVAGIFARYLLLPVPRAAIAGGVVAGIAVAWAYMAFEMDYSSLLSIEDALRLTLPVSLIVFVALLFLETDHFHLGGEARGGGGTADLPRGRRMLRLGELLIMNMVVAAGVWLGWLS
jgi:hypothetical protein